MTFRKAVEVLAVIIILALIVFAVFRILNPEDSGSGIQRFSKTELLMDTVFEIAVFTEDEAEGNRLLREAFSEVRMLEKTLSRFISGSEVDNINQAAGENPVEISSDSLQVIKEGIYLGEVSQGSFDITIAPLMDLWGFSTGEQRVPTPEEIEETLLLIDYTEVDINEQRNTVYLPREGMSLDLGGIAKGYIVDRIIQYLESQDVETAFVNAGGDIRVIGNRPDGTPWRIGIRSPRNREGQDLIAVIPISDQAVVTSGDYERFFTSDGIRYHHILDPSHGYPAAEAISVSIVARECMAADGLSTAIFVLGPQKGIELLESLPGIEGIIIDTEEKVHVSSGLQDIVEIR